MATKKKSGISSEKSSGNIFADPGLRPWRIASLSTVWYPVPRFDLYGDGRGA
jgi:hypothetical protein